MSKRNRFSILAILIFTQACTIHSQNSSSGVHAPSTPVTDTTKISPSGSTAHQFFTDPRDGQPYKTISFKNAQTGTAITWMAQNLNYKTAGSYAYYEKERNRAVYGLLYTWEAAKKACPKGWHLPTDEEWSMLVNQFGGKEKAAKALKSTDGWQDAGNGTNSSGFNALPGGLRKPDGSYNNVGGLGFWWTSTLTRNTGTAWEWNMHFGPPLYINSNAYKVFRFDANVSGALSVRCVKDN